MDRIAAALAEIESVVGAKGIIADPRDQEPYLAEVRGLFRGKARRLPGMRRVKRALDPDSIMNPGKLVGS